MTASASPAPQTYSRMQVILHWAIAALIVVQLVYNGPIQAAFNDRLEGGQLAVGGGALVHIVLGSTVLGLAVIRLLIRLRRGAPPPHAGTPRIIALAGHLTHAALYLMIFAMPLTGLVAWFAGSEWAATLHEAGRLVFIVLIGLHVAGALVEQFVLRNNVFRRMA